MTQNIYRLLCTGYHQVAMKGISESWQNLFPLPYPIPCGAQWLPHHTTGQQEMMAIHTCILIQPLEGTVNSCRSSVAWYFSGQKGQQANTVWFPQEQTLIGKKNGIAPLVNVWNSQYQSSASAHWRTGGQGVTYSLHHLPSIKKKSTGLLRTFWGFWNA